MNEEGGASVDAAVVGAGSWGTALALLLQRNGHRVRLWSHDEATASLIASQGENQRYLPGVSVPREIQVTSQMEEAVSGAGLVVSVSPSQHVGTVMADAAPFLSPDTLVVSASKGIETRSLRRMDEVLESVLPGPVHRRMVVLSGPSFALEVARSLPTAVVAASRSRDARLRVQSILSSRVFRVYTNPDLIGVELGGSVKNVIALAAGVATGLELGRNTQAALITRGLAEITRLGAALGADPVTFSGLAGIGDLVLTCTGDLSRNRTVGVRLGQGESLDRILSDMTAVAEGVHTTQAVHALARRHEVEMPITHQVHRMLHEGADPLESVQELMMRDPKPETWAQ